MLGSPNFFRGIYNGSEAEPNIRNASKAITDLFIDYHKKSGWAYDLTSFTGRSDYGPFIANGIPAGGLATGTLNFEEN